MYALTNIGAK